MKQSVNCVLLIGDDRATNFFNKMVLNRHEGFDPVISVQSSADAMMYLKTVAKELQALPDLIIVDVDRTDMDGWEFLRVFYKLDKKLTDGIKVILLSTSSGVKEVKNSMTDYRFDDYINKPLSFPMLDELLQSHFDSLFDSSL